MANFILPLFFVYTCSSVIFAYPTEYPIDEFFVSSEQPPYESANICSGELIISNVHLTTISAGFMSSSSVKNLSITNNYIEKIYEGAFKRLPFLENLNLSNNKLDINAVLSRFSEIPLLQLLILDGNFLDISTDEDRYKTSYCPLDKYWSINYGDCKNKYYPLGPIYFNYVFYNLCYLSLQNIHINSIRWPWFWQSKFPKLEYLDLSENYFRDAKYLFDDIPLTLKTLKLKSCEMSFLKIGRSSNLIELHLDNNNFEKLSIENCNYETTLCLKNLPDLKVLHISNCSIDEIDSSAFSELQNLIHLDISYNKFFGLAEDTFNGTSLLSLDLSGNSLTSLNLFSLEELRTLTMNNMASRISFLLEDVPELPNLTTLRLRKNNLDSVPANMPTKFPNLELLDLSFNSIKNMPSNECLSSLRNLYLTSNKFMNIRDLSLYDYAPSLENLALADNHISSIKVSDMKFLPENLTIYLA